jgi:hypothetical protein
MIWKRAARHPKPLGGAGQIVEIDETVLASSKARQHIRIAVSVNNGAMSFWRLWNAAVIESADLVVQVMPSFLAERHKSLQNQ